MEKNNAQKSYTDRGWTHQRILTIDSAAENECDQLGTLAGQDIGRIANAIGTVNTLHQLAIECWIQNIQKVRKWFKNLVITTNIESKAQMLIIKEKL